MQCLAPCIWLGSLDGNALPICLIPSYDKKISLPLVFQHSDQNYESLLQWFSSVKETIPSSSMTFSKSFPLQRHASKTISKATITIQYIQNRGSQENATWNPEQEFNQLIHLLDGAYFTDSINSILCESKQYLFIVSISSFTPLQHDQQLLRIHSIKTKIEIQYSPQVVQKLLQSKSLISWKQQQFPSLYSDLLFMKKVDQFLRNIFNSTENSISSGNISWIFITGKSGCGKTTAVRNSLLTHNESVIIVEPLDYLTSLLQHVDSQNKIIILFDENELREEFSNNSHFLSNWNSKLKEFSQQFQIFCVVVTSNSSLISSIAISNHRYIFGQGNHFEMSNKEWQLNWEDKMGFIRHLFLHGAEPLQQETIEAIIRYLEENPKILFTEAKTVGDLMEFYRFCMWKWQISSYLDVFLPSLQEYRNIHKNLLSSNQDPEEESSLVIEDETLSIQRLMSWDSIGGNEDIKQKMEQIIEWPILYRQSFTKLNLMSSNATVFGNILFYGPPGCAKTTIVRTMASQLYHKRLIKRFFSVNAAKLFSKFLGESEEYLRRLFAIMRQEEEEGIANMLFIDEIDTIVCNRDAGGNADGGSGRILSTLLNELDGIQKQGSHIFICSTNRPDMIDSALLRPGRIDHLVYVGPPSVQQRHQILEVYSKQIQEKDAVNLQTILWNIAWRTDLYTGADLEAVVREALLQFYVRNNDKSSLQQCFEKALQMVKPTVNTGMLALYTSFQQRI